MKEFNFNYVPMVKVNIEQFAELYEAKRQIEMEEFTKNLFQTGRGSLYFDLVKIANVNPFIFMDEKLADFVKANAPESEYIGKVSLVVNFTDDCKNKRDRNSFFVNHPLFSSSAIVMRARQCGRTLMTKQMMDTGLGTIREMELLERKVCKWLDDSKLK